MDAKFNLGTLYDQQCRDMIEICYRGMKRIMEIYRQDFDVEIKSDNSPVTQADKEVDQMIRDYFSSREEYSTYRFLTEESVDDSSRLTAEYVFIVDPLDGTKDFVDRDDMFAINIALVKRHLPVVGVVGIPAQNKVYFAIRGAGSYVIEERGATPRKIHVSGKEDNLILLTSKFHESSDEIKLMAMFKDQIADIKRLGSALKSCLLAEGKADVSFNFSGNTKEWDTCAPQIIVEEAGGIYTTSRGDEISYNRLDVYNRYGYAIYNGRPGNNLSVRYLAAEQNKAR